MNSSDTHHHNETQIVADPALPTILITREFDAPPERVFRAYTDPDLVGRWLGPRALRMRIDQFDARSGGSYRYVHSDDEGTEYGFHGVFHGTPSPDGIVQTFEYEGTPGHVSLETLTFEERDGKTVLRTNTVYQSVADRDFMLESGMEEGFNESSELLASLVATLAAGTGV